MASIRLAMIQTNPTVGAFSANLETIFNQVQKAAAEGVRLAVFGEMSVTGYPIEDLAQRESFVLASELAVADFATRLEAAGLGEICVVLGHPSKAEESNGWAIANNSASVILGGRIIASYAKHHLPNYSVFDEYRVFVPGTEPCIFELDGSRFGVLICEDIWQAGGPVAALKGQNLDAVLVLNGSPFEIGKEQARRELVRGLALELDAAAIYVNLYGGQDDLVFDGKSLAWSADGRVFSVGAGFMLDRVLLDLENKTFTNCKATEIVLQPSIADVWTALTIGLQDYVEKNGFKSVILGLSGGIDSAVCAALAVDAIGPERVFGVSLPSRYSSDHSKSDAFDLARRLGVHIRTEAIADIVQVSEEQLGLTGLAAENLQARVRGLVLMALSNAEGHLVLTTGNKTELSVGYSTIYGDSVGGYAPLKDVPKTMVWELAKYRNAMAGAGAGADTGPIPENSISKPPSAELRPDQLDQDSLPEYDLLDAILERYIDERQGRAEIIGAGFEPETVDRVISLVDKAEWKRRQGAIGPKITGMAFGRDRRLPITNGFRES